MQVNIIRNRKFAKVSADNFAGKNESDNFLTFKNDFTKCTLNIF